MQGDATARNRFSFEMLQGSAAKRQGSAMSQQLTISSLFSVLALGLLCVTTTLRDLPAEDPAFLPPASLTSKQAGLAPGLLAD